MSAHVYGRVKLLDDADSRLHILEESVRRFEARTGDKPWVFRPKHGYQAALMKGIMPFEIEARRVEAQFKLEQNKSADDRRRVAARLRKSKRTGDRALAEAIERTL